MYLQYMTSHLINLCLTNGFSHHYQLDESTFVFRGVRGDFYFLTYCSMKFLCANRIAPAASHLGLCCLPMSHKRDARRKCVKDQWTPHQENMSVKCTPP